MRFFRIRAGNSKKGIKESYTAERGELAEFVIYDHLINGILFKCFLDNTYETR